MRRKLLILILTFTAALLIGAVVIVMVQTSDHSGQIDTDKHPTNSHVSFENDTPTADPAILGRWQNDVNPQWFRVYYDDYDGDGFFWGKEWNEAEDVQESDLNYHGNGWFRWQKNDNQLLELHTMDANDTPIPKRWILRSLSSQDSLILNDYVIQTRYFRFKRIAEW